jgi:transcriptional regulator with AAA-type ATPase domain
MSVKKKIRTTLVLEDNVLKKLKQKSEGNISELANKILKTALFGKGESMFGELKGIVSTKDVCKEETHEDLYR